MLAFSGPEIAFFTWDEPQLMWRYSLTIRKGVLSTIVCHVLQIALASGAIQYGTLDAGKQTALLVLLLSLMCTEHIAYEQRKDLLVSI